MQINTDTQYIESEWKLMRPKRRFVATQRDGRFDAHFDEQIAPISAGRYKFIAPSAGHGALCHWPTLPASIAGVTGARPDHPVNTPPGEG